jgi:hypothetical protein
MVDSLVAYEQHARVIREMLQRQMEVVAAEDDVEAALEARDFLAEILRLLKLAEGYGTGERKRQAASRRR